jgi:hypothetical protein
MPINLLSMGVMSQDVRKTPQVRLSSRTNELRVHYHLVLWNRTLRLSTVGRNLFFSVALGLIFCCWLLFTEPLGWQKGSGVVSTAFSYLLPCWGVGIVVLAILDTRSRFQNYKRAKDLFFENGFKSRIAKIYIHSRCQRDAVRVAARDLGLLEQLDRFYRDQGYHWYHIFPDFLFKKPGIVFSWRYWKKTLFEPQYISNHFLW